MRAEDIGPCPLLLAREAARLSSAVFHPAAVRFGLRHCRLLARFQFFDGFAHVISRRSGISLVRGPIINSALVSENAVLIDHKHMRCRSHAVLFSYLARAVINPGGRLNL